MCVVCLMDIKNEINLKFAIARIANTQKTFSFRSLYEGKHRRKLHPKCTILSQFWLGTTEESDVLVSRWSRLSTLLSPLIFGPKPSSNSSCSDWIMDFLDLAFKVLSQHCLHSLRKNSIHILDIKQIGKKALSTISECCVEYPNTG